MKEPSNHANILTKPDPRTFWTNDDSGIFGKVPSGPILYRKHTLVITLHKGKVLGKILALLAFLIIPSATLECTSQSLFYKSLYKSLSLFFFFSKSKACIPLNTAWWIMYVQVLREQSDESISWSRGQRNRIKWANTRVPVSLPGWRKVLKTLSESESRSIAPDSLWSHGLYSPWNSPGQNTGVGSLSLLQGIFPTQGSNPGFPHCNLILYQLSHKGSPLKTLRQVVFQMLSGGQMWLVLSIPNYKSNQNQRNATFWVWGICFCYIIKNCTPTKGRVCFYRKLKTLFHSFSQTHWAVRPNDMK